MAMSVEQANYCDNLKTGNIEVALLRCDVVSGRNLDEDVYRGQRFNIFAKAKFEDKSMSDVIDDYAFEASKVVNTKLLEIMGCQS